MGEVYEGRCHCGAVRFEAELIGGLGCPERCNCSYCQKRGSVTLKAEAASLKVVKGFDVLRVYTFGSHSTKHFFCARCGVHTHHEMRTNARTVAVNAACLQGLSPFDFEVVPVIDGASMPDESVPVSEPRQVGVVTYAPDFGASEDDEADDDYSITALG